MLQNGLWCYKTIYGTIQNIWCYKIPVQNNLGRYKVTIDVTKRHGPEKTTCYVMTLKNNQNATKRPRDMTYRTYNALKRIGSDTKRYVIRNKATKQPGTLHSKHSCYKTTCGTKKRLVTLWRYKTTRTLQNDLGTLQNIWCFKTICDVT